MEISTAELLDRFTIVLRKKMFLANNDEIEKEYETLKELLIRKAFFDVETVELVARLMASNSDVWNLESDIRGGNEAILGLAEVGRRALKIREYNKMRVDAKNKITEKFKDGFREIKVNHRST